MQRPTAGHCRARGRGGDGGRGGRRTAQSQPARRRDRIASHHHVVHHHHLEHHGDHGGSEDHRQAGDRQRALSVAAPGAVDKLFALDRRPRPRFTACRSEPPGFRRHYAIPDANGVFFIDMLVSGAASAGWRVESVEFVGDSD
jgi:hypothetical protein